MKSLNHFFEKFPNALDWAFWAEDDEEQLLHPVRLYSENGLVLQLTCGACPEQYEVFDTTTGEQVGYLRLRHGDFIVQFPNENGEIIYQVSPTGDGVFEDDERMKYLAEAMNAILAKTKKQTA